MENNNELNIQKKVLVVEDDEFLRDLLAKKLLNEGYDVKSCFDHKGAFAVLGKEKPDIILLDLILPEVDGFGILEKIKADEELKSIPVLILSNHGQKEDVDRVMALGAYGFLVKANFTLDEIIIKIQNIFIDIDTR